MAPIKLAILDDYQNLAAPKFAALVRAGKVEVTTFPQTLDIRIPGEKEAQIQRLRPFEIVSTMRERSVFDAEVIASLPRLKLLLTTGVKNTALDVAAATKHGVTVAGTTAAPGGPDSTTQHNWALILGLARHVARDDASVKAGAWQGATLATDLAGKTLGLVGLGRLGSATARIAVLAFGLKIIAWSTSLTQERADQTVQELGLPAGSITVVSSKRDLFRHADIISLHYVLSDRSRGIVGKEELAAMKPSALLVNTSRGPLVDEAALLETLQAGKIRGAALDVYEKEPLPADSVWRTTPWGKDGRSEVLLSPHVGYGSHENIDRWYDQTLQNVERYVEGKGVERVFNVPA
jgi:glycerate dehydrogenase